MAGALLMGALWMRSYWRTDVLGMPAWGVADHRTWSVCTYPGLVQLQLAPFGSSGWTLQSDDVSPHLHRGLWEWTWLRASGSDIITFPTWAPVVVLVLAALVLHRAARAGSAPGLCTRCGYPVGAAARCPECGADARARPA